MKKALIVVDFQNDFVSGSLGFEKAKDLEPIICEKIAHCKKEGYDILFTFDTHDETYLTTKEGQNLPVVHCIAGTEGHNLYGKVATYVDQNSLCFHKSAFGSVALASYLKEQGYTHMELVGLVSNICVLTNAVLIKSFIPEGDVIVHKGATAGADEALHASALAVLQGIHIQVL